MFLVAFHAKMNFEFCNRLSEYLLQSPSDSVHVHCSYLIREIAKKNKSRFGCVSNKNPFFLLFIIVVFEFTGNRGPLNVTIVQVGGGNGSNAGNDLLGLEPPTELKPSPSPLSETSATLPSDNNDTFTGGILLFLSNFFIHCISG